MATSRLRGLLGEENETSSVEESESRREADMREFEFTNTIMKVINNEIPIIKYKRILIKFIILLD